MTTSVKHQIQYWDKVAGRICDANSPGKDLVGYHSPYDVYARRAAVNLLNKFSHLCINKDCIAELGSGTGLNLRYFSRWKPKKLLAFDCSSQLLALAKKNLVDLSNIEFIQTNGNDLPAPHGVSIDLLFTVTVLQHIVDPDLFRQVVESMKNSGAQYILIIEDTNNRLRQPTPDYTQRTLEDYISAFDGRYKLATSEFVSLSWASRMFGLVNRLFGLYKRDEGSRLPRPVFWVLRFLSPVTKLFDAFLPGGFGMTAVLLRLR